MRRGRRVYHKGLAVEDVCKVACEFYAVDEFFAGFFAAFDTETEDRALAIGKIFFGSFVIGMRRHIGLPMSTRTRNRRSPIC